MKKVFLALCAFTISLSACKQIESPVESDEDVAIESSQVKEYDVQGLNVTLVENEIVINSRMEWEILIKKSSQQTHDTIDFTKYTLVGYKVKVSGCEDPVVKKKVFKNKNKKHYKVRYQVMRRGDCDKQIERVYWLLIPKTEAGFKIIFVREDDEDDCHHDKDSADSNHTQMNLLARFWASDSSYGR